ncbi:ABC transporter substrate-binding protein [Paenibacillus ginsengihumi]|uniref:ABC transporter substrate-binding protein n=1 Tax=Paenibacillus ginsengihumi TaxID=431596 RepID=UPI00037308B7|nr:extracellular solute-binding protein [Paenibacillus ginsengihumi]
MKRRGTVKLSFLSWLSPKQFHKLIAEPVSRRMPYIQLEYANDDPLGNLDIRRLLHADRQPDLLLLPAFLLCDPEMSLNGFLCDLSGLRQEYSLGASRFHASMTAALRGMSRGGGRIGLPFDLREYALVYNKEIFDRFGVPYPADGMTWEETVELARRVTGCAGGKPYRGLDPGDLALMRLQLAVEYIDPVTKRSKLLDPRWRLIAETVRAIYAIPGNMPSSPHTVLRFHGAFARARDVAMSVVCLSCFDEKELDFPWDMVSYPTFAAYPGIKPFVGDRYLMIGASCLHREEAFRTVAYLTSDEYQSFLSQNGYHSALRSAKIGEAFGECMPIYAGSNRGAFSRNRHAPPVVQPGRLELELNVSGMVRRAFTSMVEEKKRVEDTLAELDAALNRAIFAAQREERGFACL